MQTGKLVTCQIKNTRMYFYLKTWSRSLQCEDRSDAVCREAAVSYQLLSATPVWAESND